MALKAINLTQNQSKLPILYRKKSLWLLTVFFVVSIKRAS
jgi:hypothetical protein